MKAILNPTLMATIRVYVESTGRLTVFVESSLDPDQAEEVRATLRGIDLAPGKNYRTRVEAPCTDA